MDARSEFMQLALGAAERARGRTRPNPMVGCVIVRGREVVAMGYHERAGTAHAEVVALGRAGERARGADLYVTLEPCNHWGRTGPCTEALIAAGVGRVFVGARDPNPIVNGAGIRRVRRAGIPVEVGVLESECRRLNEAYECTMRERRPFVVAKTAQSLDGRVATRAGESHWITGEEARAYSHRLRDELDAILVGRNTVVSDDPQLNCRLKGGRDPVRVILDTEARVSPRAKVVVLGKSSSAPTWIAVGPHAPAKRRLALERAGAETILCKLKRGAIYVADLLKRLHQRELMSLLVEGGPTVLGSFFDAGLVDKVHTFLAPLIIGGEGARAAVGARGVAHLCDATRLAEVEIITLGEDVLVTGYPRPLAIPRTVRPRARV